MGSSLRCRRCGNREKFCAQQAARGTVAVAVDGGGTWLENIDDPVEATLDWDEPSGPYICSHCGAKEVDWCVSGKWFANDVYAKPASELAAIVDAIRAYLWVDHCDDGLFANRDKAMGGDDFVRYVSGLLHGYQLGPASAKEEEA